MEEIGKTLVKFWELCRRSPMARAAAVAVPGAGNSLAVLMSAKDHDELLAKFSEIATEQQEQAVLLREIRSQLQRHRSDSRPIIAVGSGNDEQLLSCEDEVVLGRKHCVTREERFGGSCVNYALRLLNCGVPVLPIASIGDDLMGNRIREAMLMSAKDNCKHDAVIRFLESNAMLTPGLTTPHSTVISHGVHRTIFSQEPEGAEYFTGTLEGRLAKAEETIGGMPGTVLVGHIYENLEAEDQTSGGASFKLLIERYAGRIPIIVNFGNTQIEHRAQYWEDLLQEVSVLQLSLEEMRRLLAGRGRRRSLKQILDWLSKRSITAVVTLGNLGAIGQYKGGQEGLLFAWSIIPSEDVKDPTGAGDAFAAGVAATLRDSPELSFETFRGSLAVGRLWGAYACTQARGPDRCPTEELLAAFHADAAERSEFRPVEQLSGYRADELVHLIDLAYG